MLEVKVVVGVSQANNRFRQRILIVNCMHNSNVVFVLHMLNSLFSCFVHLFLHIGFVFLLVNKIFFKFIEGKDGL